MDLRVDDLTGPGIAALIGAHLEYARRHSPACSRHALDLDGLRLPEVTLWSAWEGPDLVGCGALRELDPRHGEIKAMSTAEPFRRRGVASTLLVHILGVARGRGYERVSLETGSQDAFAPARALYRRSGFEACPPFGSYVEDPNSVYMARRP